MTTNDTRLAAVESDAAALKATMQSHETSCRERMEQMHAGFQVVHARIDKVTAAVERNSRALNIGLGAVIAMQFVIQLLVRYFLAN